jgi:beta-phosphoglucomutase-like phosphatase (HAD superfamily)
MIPGKPVGLIPEHIKALVFDCDGTLLNTMPLHWRAWCKVCHDTGLNFEKEDFYVLAGVPGKKIISVLAAHQGKIVDAQEVYERKRNYFLSELSTVVPIQCVIQYVHEANERGIPVAVASGSSRKQVEKGV